MVKSVIIFQNINDLISFEKYMSIKVLPIFLQAQKLKRIQVTTYKPSGLTAPKNLSSIQIVLDLYWESLDAMQIFLESPDGEQAAKLVMNNPFSEVGAFMSKERSLRPKPNASF